MALSSTTEGFWPRKNLSGPDIPNALEFIITDSETVTLGDAVDVIVGFATVVDPGDRVMGVVVGIVDNNGVPVNHPDADIDGTVTGDDTYAAAGDNETDKKCKVQLVVSNDVLYYNDADSTLTQAEVGTYFDTVANGDQITGSGGSSGQFILVSIDPDEDGDLSKGLFKIAEGQLDL